MFGKVCNHPDNLGEYLNLNTIPATIGFDWGIVVVHVNKRLNRFHESRMSTQQSGNRSCLFDRGRIVLID